MAIDKLEWKESDEGNEGITVDNEELSIKLLYSKINEIIDWINSQ